MKIKSSKTAKKSGSAPVVKWKKVDAIIWEGYINEIERLYVQKETDGWHTCIYVSPQRCTRSRYAYSSAKAAKRGAERLVKWLREMYG